MCRKNEYDVYDEDIVSPPPTPTEGGSPPLKSSPPLKFKNSAPTPNFRPPAPPCSQGGVHSMEYTLNTHGKQLLFAFGPPRLSAMVL